MGYDKIIIILSTSCGSRCNSYMGFYKNILCSGLLHSNDHPRTPDIQTYVGKRILAVMNDFQICKHLLVAEGDTDTVMFSPRFL